MNEERLTNQIQNANTHLDERLARYYKAEVQELPLSEDAWLELQAQLSPRKKYANIYKYVQRFLPYPLRSSSTPVPLYLQEKLEQLIREANFVQPLPAVSYRILRRGEMPEVRVSTFGKGKIQLRMPAMATYLPGSPELDVTLATGLARHCYMKTRRFRSAYLLSMAGFFLLLPVLLMGWLWHVPFILFVIALLADALLICAGLWYRHVALRKAVFQADMLTVIWLGRERVCRGLHALADRTRRPQKRRRGEPSLSERIERVCGTRKLLEDERLTLVR